jgi:cytochrome b561
MVGKDNVIVVSEGDVELAIESRCARAKKGGLSGIFCHL